MATPVSDALAAAAAALCATSVSLFGAQHGDGDHGAAGRSLGSASTGTLIDGELFGNTFSLFMAQVFVILSLSKLFSKALSYIRQPAVVGEMLAGIVLGPTVLGRVPGFSAKLFPPQSLGIIKTIADFALIFFMFIVGLELDPAKLKADARVSMVVSAVGIVVPAGVSALLALMFYNDDFVVVQTTPFVNLVLFLTVTLGMSALPVLARILSERRMLTTRLGALAMTVAAVDDIIGWCLLAITIALTRSASQLGVLWTILVTIGELLFMYFVVGPLIRWLARRSDGSGSNHHVSADTFLVLCLVLIGCSWLAEVIGLSSLIGAFQVGLLIPRTSSLAHSLSEKFEFFTVVILMPLFFTSSGLRTQFGLINSGYTFGIAVLVIAVATGSKIIGITLPCMYYRIPTRLSLIIGVLMSCKGLVALIVVNIANDQGMITPLFFAILVLMVLITTLSTVPLMDCVDPPSNAVRRAADTAKFEAMIAQKDKKEPQAQAALPLVGATSGGADGSGDGMVPSPSANSLAASTNSDSDAETPRGLEEGGEAKDAASADAAAAGAGGVAGLLRSISRGVSQRLRTASGGALGSSPSPALGPAAASHGAAVGQTPRAAKPAAQPPADLEAGAPDGLELPPLAAAPVQPASERPLRGRPAAAGSLHVGMAVSSDTSAAPSMVTASNLFSLPTARLTLLYMLEALEMPSAYMKWISSPSEIRDATLSSSLARSRLRDAEGGLGLSALPSSHVLADTLSEARARAVDVLLLPAAFFKPDAGMGSVRPSLASRRRAGTLSSSAAAAAAPPRAAAASVGGPPAAAARAAAAALDAGPAAASGSASFSSAAADEPAPPLLVEEDEDVVATLLKAICSARPCLTGVLFENDAGILYSSSRVLALVPAGSRVAEPALALLRRCASDVHVTLLRPGAAPPLRAAGAALSPAGASASGTPAPLARAASAWSLARDASSSDVGLEGDGDEGDDSDGGISRSASSSRAWPQPGGAAGPATPAHAGRRRLSADLAEAGAVGGTPGAAAPPAFARLPTVAEAAESLNSVTGPALRSELPAALAAGGPRLDALPEGGSGLEAGWEGARAPLSADASAAAAGGAAAEPPPNVAAAPPLPAIPSALRRRGNVREVLPLRPEPLPALQAHVQAHGAEYSLLVLGAQPDVAPGSDAGAVGAAQEACARAVAQAMALAAAHRIAVLVVL